VDDRYVVLKRPFSWLNRLNLVALANRLGQPFFARPDGSPDGAARLLPTRVRKFAGERSRSEKCGRNREEQKTGVQLCRLG
jgi:hypothetical protein